MIKACKMHKVASVSYLTKFSSSLYWCSISLWIFQVTSYFMELASPHTHEVIKFVDKVGGFEWLIQKYEIDGATGVKLDLSLDTPIIIVPKNSTSEEYVSLTYYFTCFFGWYVFVDFAYLIATYILELPLHALWICTAESYVWCFGLFHIELACGRWWFDFLSRIGTLEIS